MLVPVLSLVVVGACRPVLDQVAELNDPTCVVKDSFAADLDGDGGDEMILITGCGVQVLFSADGPGGGLEFVSLIGVEFALGDVNNDGHLDAVAAQTFGEIVAYLNDGTGVMTPVPGVGASENPRDIALLDADGDGDLDAAISRSPGGTIDIYINDGFGSFAKGPVVDLIEQPFELAGLDADLDGLSELLVFDHLNDTVVMLSNDGGSFSMGPTLVSNIPAPHDLYVKELNGDGIGDVVVPNETGNISVVLSRAPGQFDTVFYPWGAATDVAFDDVDGDGDLDVFVMNPVADIVSVWVNKGDGTLIEVPSLETLPLKAELLVGNFFGGHEQTLVAGVGPLLGDITFEFLSIGCVPTCDADLNYDGIVNTSDLALALSGFGKTSAGDADGDLDTDSADLNDVLWEFGATCDN